MTRCLSILALLLCAGCALGPRDTREQFDDCPPFGPLTPFGWRYTDVPMTQCVWCLRSDMKLNRHHLIPQGVRPDLANSQTGNVIVVFCRDCHYRIGHMGRGWSYDNTNLLKILHAAGTQP